MMAHGHGGGMVVLVGFDKGKHVETHLFGLFDLQITITWEP